MKYRKKPVEIEAFLYDGDLMSSDGMFYVPSWAEKAYKDGVMYYDSIAENEPPCELFIQTLEGRYHVSVGDFIIRGVRGEIYPCKPDIFEQTYELVREKTKANTMIDQINVVVDRGRRSRLCQCIQEL